MEFLVYTQCCCARHPFPSVSSFSANKSMFHWYTCWAAPHFLSLFPSLFLKKNKERLSRARAVGGRSTTRTASSGTRARPTRRKSQAMRAQNQTQVGQVTFTLIVLLVLVKCLLFVLTSGVNFSSMENVWFFIDFKKIGALKKVRFDSHSYNLPERSGRKAGAVSRP